MKLPKNQLWEKNPKIGNKPAQKSLNNQHKNPRKSTAKLPKKINLQKKNYRKSVISHQKQNSRKIHLKKKTPKIGNKPAWNKTGKESARPRVELDDETPHQIGDKNPRKEDIDEKQL